MVEYNQDARAMERELRALRERLVDDNKRNRLIHINRNATRANCINVVREESEHIFRILRVEGRKMQFKATSDDNDEGENGENLFLFTDFFGKDEEAVSTDRYLETNLGPDGLARRILRVAQAARTAEGEMGINILYLAMGFLQWKESPSSDIVLESPLILLPVNLKRSSKGAKFNVSCRDDDITTNLLLAKRMSKDFGIDLPDIDDREEWTPSSYFAAVQDAISNHPDWTIDEDGMQLGFFSFAKHLMYRDLDPANWEQGSFAENPILGGLIGSRHFDHEGCGMFSENTNIDSLLDPADIVQVISADTSQTKVIEEVRAGANLVVHGPPGTGKSQTIANIIAAAVHDGKRVLFVAEKMAALSVVHSRLEKADLGPICLELHSHKANKKSVLQEIEKSLNTDAPTVEEESAFNLLKVRNHLNEICNMLHKPLDGTDETPYDALTEIIGFTGKEEISFLIGQDDLDRIDRDQREGVFNVIRRYADMVSKVGDADSHPFRHVRNFDLQPTDMKRLDYLINRAMSGIDILDDQTRRIAAEVGQPMPECIADASILVRVMDALAEAPSEIAEFANPLIRYAGTARLEEALKTGSRWADAMKEAGRYLPDSSWKAVAERGCLDQMTKTATSAIGTLEDRAHRLATEMSRPVPENIANANRLANAADMLNGAPDGITKYAKSLMPYAGTDQLRNALDAGIQWAEAKKEADNNGQFSSLAWSADADTETLYQELVRGRDSWWFRTFGGFRKALRELSVLLLNPPPQDRNAVCNLAKQLMVLRGLQSEFTDVEDWLEGILGPHWHGLNTPLADVLEMSSWLGNLKERGEFTADEIVRLLVDVKNPAKDSEDLSAKSANCRAAVQEIIEHTSLDLQDVFGCGIDNIPFDTLRKAFGAVHRALGSMCEFADDEVWLQGILGTHWRGPDTPFTTIRDVSTWIGNLKKCGEFTSDEIVSLLDTVKDPNQESENIASESANCHNALREIIKQVDFDVQGAFGCEIDEVPLTAVKAALVGMVGNQGAYDDWKDLAHARKDFADSAASPIMKILDLGSYTVEEAVNGFKFACAEARWKAALNSRPEIRTLERVDRHALVRQFRNLEGARIESTRAKILSDHIGQMPTERSGGMAIILGEIGRKRGHRPIRRLISDAGETVQRIKPVMLMSPISVAQFLKPGAVQFDLLVIDEASQVKPEDALGAVARAKQIVVVGDQKQLPPTAFFDRLMDETEEDEEEDEPPAAAAAAEMESVLNLCTSRGMRNAILRWHYRSRDPSLIQVSNVEFYNGELILPPSPLEKDDDYGMKFTRVEGVYARGKGPGRQGTNRIEAEAVADCLVDHARKWPDLSVGVVAFSRNQADMLTEVLELRRRDDLVLDAFLREGKSEDVFVKNIENVQGDERDVILISVGYGPSEAGSRLNSSNFGPVNKEGGERRLNVLFTRSRVRCEIFSSFDPGDIKVETARRDGLRVFKRFLKFAQEGIIDESRPTGLDFDSDFERDIASVIRGLGYDLDPQVGIAGFRIDIGVKNPDQQDQYIIAVECDGARYHSALSARERDRHRQDVLEGMGWKFHRIWSTDWYYHREREIGKLKDALEHARTHSRDGIRVPGANDL